MRSSYLGCILDPEQRDLVVERAIQLLEPLEDEFDYLAFSGMSGAIIAPIVAKELNKGIVLVRKDGDSSHSAYMKVEGGTDGRFIVFDDFSATGNTIRYILNTIRDMPALQLTPSGIYLYRGKGWWTFENLSTEFNLPIFGDDDPPEVFAT